MFGVLVDSETPPDAGDAVIRNGQPAGVITCAMRSRLTGKTMAVARLDPTVAVHGTDLEVRGKSGSVKAMAHTMPFDDPEKKKRTAAG